MEQEKKSATIDILPVWKKNSTPYEWLQECAAVALAHPERFGKIALIFEETLPNGNTKTRNLSYHVQVTELVGLIELAKSDIIEYSKR